jgi:hypothetical protein
VSFDRRLAVKIRLQVAAASSAGRTMSKSTGPFSRSKSSPLPTIEPADPRERTNRRVNRRVLTPLSRHRRNMALRSVHGSRLQVQVTCYRASQSNRLFRSGSKRRDNPFLEPTRLLVDESGVLRDRRSVPFQIDDALEPCRIERIRGAGAGRLVSFARRAASSRRQITDDR